MAIQITGAAADIERIITSNILREARPRNRGAYTWIEVDELTDEAFTSIVKSNVKVHDPSRIT